MPSKSSGQFVKITKSRYLQNSSQSMKMFSAEIYARYQTILVEDQVPRFEGPDINPHCLQSQIKINTFSESVP